MSSYAADLPATVNKGDLLLVHWACRGGGGRSISTVGWTEIQNTAGTPVHLIGKRLADGTEGSGTVAMSQGTSRGAAQVYRITNWVGALSGVEIGTLGSGVSDSPNPPSLTASWGALDNLFITFVGGQDDDATVSSYSTNYTDGTATLGGGGGNLSGAVYSSRRELAAATDNPGVYTLSESEGWHANTLVIQPASGFPPALFTYAQRRSTLLRM